MTYLISSADLNQNAASPTTELLYIKERMKSFIEEKLGAGYTSYEEFLNVRLLRELVEEGKASQLTRLLNTNCQYFTSKVSDNIVPKLFDGVFYFEEFDVVYVYFQLRTIDGFLRSQYCFYAKNNESINAFLSFKEEREKQRQLEVVEIFKDTRNGVRRNEERITRSVTREHVYMDQQIKDDIFRSIDTFFGKGKIFYSEYNLPYKRGILLYGPPGNGKTTLVKSIASSVDAPVAYYQINEFTTGESIQEVFEDAAQLAPVVLVIEDVDSLPEKARSAFLNVLDGATSKEGIFLIGTTNYPEKVDEGLKNRAGRFDRMYEISKPDASLRRQFFVNTKLRDSLREEEMDQVVEKTDEFSLAQLNELYTALAMDLYEGREMNIEASIDALQQLNQKQKTNKWENQTVTVGFAR